MIKLSIITVNLNNSTGLRKTIKSVVNQTYKHFEYIVIDGGSTDGSVDVIKEYSNNLSYWVSEPDTGIYNAMNKGILVANGEYLQFLNSGDWLVNDTVIENILKEMPPCDLFHGNMVMVMPSGRLQVNHGSKGKEITFLSLFLGTINHSPAFIRRSLFFDYGLYDEQLRIVSDWKFYLKTFGLNKLKVIYKNIDVNYFEMNGISNTQVELANSEREKVLSEIIPYPILADYINYRSDFIELTLIRKHFLTAKIYRMSQMLIVTLSKILNRLKK